MTRLQLAYYALTASALILSGLLLTRLEAFTPEAQANMVISRDAFSLMTAQTSNNEESLFVLNNTSGVLMVYKTSLAGRKSGVEPVAYVELSKVFGQ